MAILHGEQPCTPETSQTHGHVRHDHAHRHQAPTDFLARQFNQDSLQARHPHRPTKHDAKKHGTHPRTSQQVLCGEHQHGPHQDRTDPD